MTLDGATRAEYQKRLRWFTAPPSVVVLVGGESEPSGGSFNLDERHDDNLDLGAWAARAALPPLGEITHANFAAYAATGLPMLLAFVDASADNRPLLASLRSVAGRYQGKVVVGWLNGETHRTRMLALGLRDGTLPQLAFNTKDGRQLPFPPDETPNEAALSRFAARFLGDALRSAPESLPDRGPMRQPDNWTPKPGEAELVAELAPSNFSAVRVDCAATDASAPQWLSVLAPRKPSAASSCTQVAMDPTKDVVLQLYASEGCEPCVTMVMYYNRLAGRVHGSAESQAQMSTNIPGGCALPDGCFAAQSSTSPPWPSRASTCSATSCPPSSRACSSTRCRWC